MKKQIIAVILSSLLIVSFSGCSGSNEKSKSGKEADETVVSEQEETDSRTDGQEEAETDDSEEKTEESSDSKADADGETADSESGTEDTPEEEPETGNFEGLEVEDETTIEIEEGSAVVVQ